MDEQALLKALREKLGSDAIREVGICGRNLIIRTKLDPWNVERFDGEVKTILGVVMEENPDMTRVILDEAIGQWIIIPMEAMRAYHQGLMTFDEFRGTWKVVGL